MQDKEQVFLYMKEEIEMLAKAETETLLQEADALEKQACDQIREEAKKDMAMQLEKELAEITVNESMASSSKQAQRKKDLVQKRDQYVEQIFVSAKDKLVAFTKTEAYLTYLKEHLQKIYETYALDDVVVYVRGEDLVYQEDMIKAYGKEVMFKASERVKIGGFILENKDATVVLDESLAFALENQKEWFYRTSGLTIE
jgi:vacuolar-type H+-ATPase subunit E/Vma4